MKNFLYILLWVVTSVFSVPCLAGKVEISPADNKVTIPGVVTLYGEWIKEKGKKYDLSFAIQSEAPKNIIIQLSDMHCSHGDMQGELEHTFFNVGEKVINFKPHELKKFTFVCKIGSKVETGEYKIVVDTVYENASGDGKTLGKGLAKEVEWKVRIAK
jgi:hypothetical protein